MIAISPEQQLLLLCARPRPAEEELQRIRGLAGQTVQWALVADMGRLHRVNPAVYTNLVKACPSAVPAEVLNTLKSEFVATVGRHHLLITNLLLINDAFAEAGIPVMQLKGPSLAAMLYGDVNLRDYRDLDLLIKKEDIDRARVALAALGYEQEAEQRHECQFLRQDRGPIRADLHWDIVEPELKFDVVADGLWERCVSFELSGKTVLVPSLEDLLLILVAHGTRHRWRPLKLVCDLSQFGGTAIDWERLGTSAKRLRCERLLSHGLCLTELLLKTSFPEPFVGNGRTRRMARSEARLLLKWDGGSGKLAAEQYALSRVLEGGIEYRSLHVVRYYLRALLEPQAPDLAVIRLPSFFSLVYFPIRALRLLFKYAITKPAESVARVAQKWMRR